MAEVSSATKRLQLTRRSLVQAGIASAGLVAGVLPGVGRPGIARADHLHSGEEGHPYVPRPGRAEYTFDVQRTTLNPDGLKPMPGTTVNGVLPGPEIRVKRGELLRI